MSRMVVVDERRSQDERLADALSALANPVRLTLLRQLREPHVLKEIEVHPYDVARAGHRDRPMSRQAVKEHLERLLQIDAVSTRETERSFGTTVEYTLNHQTLYAVSEELRRLASLRPANPPELETITANSEDAQPALAGPCLVLVKGLDEGRTFSLDPREGDQGEWVIGRRRGLEIPLDFDPFVSSENTVVRLTEEGYVIEDMPESRNGTRLNFQPLAPNQPRALRTGDLVGVGRSLLMFKGEA